MSDKSKCVKCGSELKWGGFAHNQDTCWLCFKDVILKTLENLHGEERKAIAWMMSAIGEIYSEKW